MIKSSSFNHRSMAFLFLVLLICSLQACGPAAEQPQPFTADAAVEVGLPALERQAPATRDRITLLHAQATATLERTPVDPETVAKAFGDLGSHLVAVGLFEAAADCFENARRAQSEVFRWHYYLGVARQDDSKLEQAVEAYGDALRLEPADLPARLHRVDALIELDRIDEAAADLKVAQDQNPGLAPNHAAVQFALARIAGAQGQHVDAARHFERTLELQPSATAAHYPLSQTYLRLGDRDSAEHHLSRRGEQRPSFDDALVAELGTLVSLTALEVVRSRASQSDFDPVADLGYALANLGHIGGAVERMEQIADNDAQLAGALGHEARFRYLIGGLWVNRGQDQKAEPHFRRAVELDDTLIAAQVKLGNLLSRRGLFAEALDQYTAVLEREPNLGDARIKRAAVFNRLDRPNDALSDLRIAHGLPSTHAEAAIPLAATLDRLGRAEEANSLLLKTLSSITEAQDRAALHKALGDRHKNGSRFEDALQQYAEALSLRPDLTAASLEMASILGHIGRLDKAIRAYGDVLAQQPSSVQARRGHVTALLLAGRYRESVRSLEAALGATAEPNGPETLNWNHALARLLAACPDDKVRDGTRAIRLANQVFDARPSLKRAETLAMAHAEHGDFEQASTIQRNLVAEAQKAGRPDLATQLQQRLHLYERRQAFRADAAADLIVSAPTAEGST